MRRIILLLLMLSAGVAGALETAVIPAAWKRPKMVRRLQLGRFGAAKCGQKLIFAAEIPELKTLASDRNGGISVYWDVDGNRKTGRFPGSMGADWQFNLSPARQSIAALRWFADGRRENLPDDEADAEFRGDLVIFTVNAAAAAAPVSGGRMIFNISAASGRTDSCEVPVNFAASGPELTSYTPDTGEAPAGQGLALPVCWQKKCAPGDSCAIRRAGFYEDGEKVIFGCELPGLTAASTLMFFWNTDNDLQTGRFPGSMGCDLQLNVNIAEKTLRITEHKDNSVRRQLGLYEDDYLIETVDHVVFLAVKKSVLTGRRSGPSAMQVKHTQGETARTADFKLPPASGKGFLPQRLNFIRFGSGRSFQEKSRAAVKIRRGTGSALVWDCQGERFRDTEATPAFTGEQAALELSAAGNQREYVFFAVESAQEMRQLTLTPGTLRSDSGAEIAAERLHCRFADYVVNERGEKFTDVILPAMPRPAKRQFAVLDVQVPAEAAPGTYTGTVAVSINGVSDGVIPVKLTVFPFQLPDLALLPTAFGIKSSHVSSRFRERDIAERIYQQLLSQCRRLRFGPRLLGTDPQLSLDDAGNLHTDFSAFAARAESFFRDFSVTQMVPAQLGSHGKFFRFNTLLKRDFSGPADPEFQKVWKQFIRKYADFAAGRNWLDKILFIVWDEPYSAKDVIAVAKTVRETAPEVPVSLFIDKYDPELESYVDVWLVTFNALAKLRTDPKLASKRVWLYNSGAMNNFRYGAMDLRGYYLLAFKYRIEGFLWSACNYLPACSESGGYYRNNYPQHCFMYADNAGEHVYDSWRQLLQAQGLCDYDYLALYGQLLAKHGGAMPEKISRLLPEFTADGNVTFPLRTRSQWEQAKKFIAGEIVRLQKLQ